jgi:hypothetical protein
VTDILDVFFEYPELLGDLFSFLDNTTPLEPVHFPRPVVALFIVVPIIFV